MNAQTKHTPGAWYAETGKPVPVNTRAIVISAADGPVAFATVENARLIAAAPELLDALQDILRIATAASVGVSGNSPRLERARAAIAKAVTP